MSDGTYARLPEGEGLEGGSGSSSDSDSDSDSDATPARPKMELTEVFTWMTVWVMIIFAVYSSEVRCMCMSGTLSLARRTQPLRAHCAVDVRRQAAASLEATLRHLLHSGRVRTVPDDFSVPA